MNRRHFLTNALSGAAVFGAGSPVCIGQGDFPKTNTLKQATPAELARRLGPIDPQLVAAFVGAGHNNLPRVKELIAREPNLVLASWDWGGGDWETALGGASHTGRDDIALYLLSQGARIDSFCAGMLGERDVILSLLKTNPSIATTNGPHGYTLLYHVAIGGDVPIAQALKPFLKPNAKDYNQALSAAARSGHLPMVKWLLENGVTDPNVPDGFNKTALMFAVDKNFTEIEAELRNRGAR